jgi:hypothetical protein
MVESPRRVEFEPVSIECNKTLVLLSPLVWDYVAIRFPGELEVSALAPLQSWFLRWFDADDVHELNSEGFYGVVHFMSDPAFQADETCITVDMGSAPMQAFEELIDALGELGVPRAAVG